MKEAIKNLLALKKLVYTCPQNADNRKMRKKWKLRQNLIKAREVLELKRLKKKLGAQNYTQSDASE